MTNVDTVQQAQAAHRREQGPATCRTRRRVLDAVRRLAKKRTEPPSTAPELNIKSAFDMERGRLVTLAGIASLVAVGGCGEVGTLACDSDRDCAGAALVCDIAAEHCVQCIVDGDCPGIGQWCGAGTCRERTTCISSRECPGLVCDLDRGFCVECVSDLDCGTSETCAPEGVCTALCRSDDDCASSGLVCARSGRCAECEDHADCTAGAVCRDARCEAADVPDAAMPDGAADSGADGSVGPGDAGSVDAGTGDGGSLDAGRVEEDAGGADAGAIPSDAGSRADAGSCSESPCRVASPQCGCGPTQGCYPAGVGVLCAPLGPGVEGASCSQHGDCQSGLLCHEGQCLRVCSDDAECSGRGSLCLRNATHGGAVYDVCSVSCEPATGQGCLPGDACRHFNGGSAGFFTDCVPEGSTPEDEPCSSNAQCTRNHTCVGFPDGARCSRICRLTAGNDCLICVGYVDGDPTIEGEAYGYCI